MKLQCLVLDYRIGEEKITASLGAARGELVSQSSYRSIEGEG
jgi:hypothetical protein